MSHTPYGYVIRDGAAYIDEEKAKRIRKLFDGYISGLALQPAAEKAGVLLLLTGKKSVLYGIPQLLSGIIFNLCDNAIKYNHPGGNAVIHISDDEDTVYLSVSDNGIGIPHEQQSRIFERFYRVDKSHSKEVGGTGLGLSIVKHSAKLHHAEIRLQSTLGKGTKITISFPKRHIVQLLADK